MRENWKISILFYINDISFIILVDEYNNIIMYILVYFLISFD